MCESAGRGADCPPATLSVIIPVYNERDRWRRLLERLQAVDLGGVRRQIILVDDGSTDGTGRQLRRLAAEGAQGACVVLFHPSNRGKGAAIRTGLAAADGEFVIIQDADLEYDPGDYPVLLAPLLDGTAEVVYGSRFLREQPGRAWSARYLANRFLTWLSNLTTGLKLTDMETCYKMFRRSVLKRIRLEQSRFGFEPEVTAKLARLGVGICERPVRYQPRTRGEGKKIGWRDGLVAVWCILKYGPFGGRKGMRPKPRS